MGKSKKAKDAQKINTETGFSIEKRSIIPVLIPSPSKVYTQNLGKRSSNTLMWEVPEWDLAEVGRIIDVESIVRRAFKIKKNLFLKEGYDFIGARIERTRYIKRRFQQMEYATGIPTPILISQTIGSLIRCSNAFWIKVRKEKASGGKVREFNGKKYQPVAGYFIAPAETIQFKRDEYGRITKYCQQIRGRERIEFDPEDVIHFYFDKREGLSVGTPLIIPIKDDIRALRRIEENLELLIYQHLFPLFHYQVGTENSPATTFADGTTEIEVVQMKVAQMPSDGCWVTPERHKITPLQASSAPVAVDNVIEHFKQRIYTGLGVSSVDMGQGGTANRSTAVTMSRNIIDDTKADQKEFGAQFYSFVIQELLLESTFSEDTLFDEENRVYLKFNEIDIETKQAKENHITDMFLKNIVTHDEARQMMGMEPFVGNGWPLPEKLRGDGDFARTNYGLFERDRVILQSIDEAGTELSREESKSRTTSTLGKLSMSSSPGGNSVSNKNQPQNQYGVRPSPKLNKDSINTSLVYSLPFTNKFEDLEKDIEIMINKNGVSLSQIELLIDIAFEGAQENLLSQCKSAYKKGLQENNRDIWEVQLTKVYSIISSHVNKYVKKLKHDIISSIDRNTIKDYSVKSQDYLFVSNILSSFKYRTKIIDVTETYRAYNYGLASAYRLSGFKTLTTKCSEENSCNICKRKSLNILESDVIIYEEIPPLHPGCTCLLVKDE